MFKYYDYKRANGIISRLEEMFGDSFVAVLAIKEDYQQTASLVYAGGNYKIDLLKNPTIAGLCGSSWGTPILEVITPHMCKDFSMYTYEVR